MTHKLVEQLINIKLDENDAIPKLGTRAYDAYMAGIVWGRKHGEKPTPLPQWLERDATLKSAMGVGFKNGLELRKRDEANSKSSDKLLGRVYAALAQRDPECPVVYLDTPKLRGYKNLSRADLLIAVSCLRSGTPFPGSDEGKRLLANLNKENKL